MSNRTQARLILPVWLMNEAEEIAEQNGTAVSAAVSELILQGLIKRINDGGKVSELAKAVALASEQV